MTYRRVELGYRDSPDPSHDMVIVFMRVSPVNRVAL